jgi:hypothetical protein
MVTVKFIRDEESIWTIPMIRVCSAHCSPLGTLLIVMIGVVMASQVCVASPDSGCTGKIRVLFIGAGLESLMREPFLDVNPVLCFEGWYQEEVIKRSTRLLMPRNYKELVESYDVITLKYADPMYLSTDMIKWISDSVLESGKALAFYGQGAWFYPWLDTTIADVSPVEESEDFNANQVVWIRILKPENPLIVSLPWSEMGSHGCFVRSPGVKAEMGAQVLAEKAPRGSNQGTPFLTWWEVGAGQCLAITAYYASEEISGNPFTSWEYYSDFVRNLQMFLAERQIPSNPEILHRITHVLEDCHFLRIDLESLIEFISSLGGNSGPLHERLDLAEEKLRDIDRTYLEYEFEGSLSMAKDLLTDLGNSIDLAMGLKDRTMSWIYLIEWTILTSTAVMSGTVVWTLMMKRRLYKEVETTRMARISTPSTLVYRNE